MNFQHKPRDILAPSFCLRNTIVPFAVFKMLAFCRRQAVHSSTRDTLGQGPENIILGAFDGFTGDICDLGRFDGWPWIVKLLVRFSLSLKDPLPRLDR